MRILSAVFLTPRKKNKKDPRSVTTPRFREARPWSTRCDDSSTRLEGGESRRTRPNRSWVAPMLSVVPPWGSGDTILNHDGGTWTLYRRFMARSARVVAPGFPHHIAQRGIDASRPSFETRTVRAFSILFRTGAAPLRSRFWGTT